jgi:hypothetical protein
MEYHLLYEFLSMSYCIFIVSVIVPSAGKIFLKLKSMKKNYLESTIMCSFVSIYKYIYYTHKHIYIHMEIGGVSILRVCLV